MDCVGYMVKAERPTARNWSTVCLKIFENDPLDIWQSNIFSNSLQNLVTQGLNTKLLNVPQEARDRLKETIQQVINESCQGLICVIL